MEVGVGLWTMRATARRPAAHAALYAELIEDGRLADELGFHSLWIAEHHFWYDGWCPAPLVAAAGVLGATQRLRVGTGVHLLALPQLDLALEQIDAVLSLGAGRLDLGVGLGYRDLEFDAFGRARNERGRAMEAALRELAGRRERGLPVAPVFVGGMAPAAIERAVRHGHSLLLPPTLDTRQIKALIASASEVAGAHGHPDPRPALLVHGWLTDGSEREDRAARSAIGWTMREYMGSWYEVDGRPAFAAPAWLERQVTRAVDAALIGPAEAIAERLAELSDAGVGLVVLHLTSDGAVVAHRRNMELVAEHVLPSVPGAAA